MYKKRKKVNKQAIDEYLSVICDELLKLNDDCVCAISKKFVIEDKNKPFANGVDSFPVIIINKKPEKLILPAPYNINEEGYLVHFWDKEMRIKIVYSNMVFKDKETKNRIVKNYYLSLDNEDEIRNSLNRPF